MLSSLLAMRLLDSVLVAKYYDFEPSGVPFSPEFIGSFSFKFTGKSSKISIRIMRSKSEALKAVLIAACGVATPLQQERVAPDALHLANAFAPPDFAKTTLVV